MSNDKDIREARDILGNALLDFAWCAEVMDDVKNSGNSSNELRNMVCKIEDILWILRHKVLKDK